MAPRTPKARSISPAVAVENAVPLTRKTSSSTVSPCESEWMMEPTSAIATAIDGEPTRINPYANIQIGVTTPAGPTRIQVAGVRSQINSSVAMTPNGNHAMSGWP